MFRPSIYKCLNNSELAYYFAGRVACQPLLLVGKNPEMEWVCMLRHFLGNKGTCANLFTAVKTLSIPLGYKLE